MVALLLWDFHAQAALNVFVIVVAATFKEVQTSGNPVSAAVQQPSPCPNGIILDS